MLQNMVYHKAGPYDLVGEHTDVLHYWGLLGTTCWCQLEECHPPIGSLCWNRRLSDPSTAQC